MKAHPFQFLPRGISFLTDTDNVSRNVSVPTGRNVLSDKWKMKEADEKKFQFLPAGMSFQTKKWIISSATVVSVPTGRNVLSDNVVRITDWFNQVSVPTGRNVLSDH